MWSLSFLKWQYKPMELGVFRSVVSWDEQESCWWETKYNVKDVVNSEDCNVTFWSVGVCRPVPGEKKL